MLFDFSDFLTNKSAKLSNGQLSECSISFSDTEVTTLTMMCVFGRLMSQLADVNTQSTVGMFHFCDISCCCFCTPCCLYTVV